MAVLLVQSGSKGDRLLFKYPPTRKHSEHNYARNPYGIVISEDYGVRRAYERPTGDTHQRSFIGAEGQLAGSLSDRLCATLLGVKLDLCNKPFSLRLNDVKFVGFPASVSLS